MTEQQQTAIRQAMADLCFGYQELCFNGAIESIVNLYLRFPVLLQDYRKDAIEAYEYAKQDDLLDDYNLQWVKAEHWNYAA